MVAPCTCNAVGLGSIPTLSTDYKNKYLTQQKPKIMFLKKINGLRKRIQKS